MKSGFILKAVMHNLRHRKGAFLISVFAIACAFTFLSAVGSVTFGLAASAVNSSLKYPLIVGPEGSSDTQLVMSSIFSIDKPRAKVSYKVFEELKKDPRVVEAYPMARADSIKGVPIVGVDNAFIRDVNEGFLQFKEGLDPDHIFDEKDMFRAVVGYKVSEKYGLKLGSRFVGSHGSVGDPGAHVHDEFTYTVVAVMNPVQGPEDFLVYSSVPSVWKIHDHDHGHLHHHHHGDDDHHHADKEHGHHHEDGDHHEHEHDHEKGEHHHEDGDHHEHEHDHEKGEHHHEDGDHHEHEHDHEKGEHHHEDGDHHEHEHDHEKGDHHHEDGDHHEHEHDHEKGDHHHEDGDHHKDGHEHGKDEFKDSMDLRTGELSAILVKTKNPVVTSQLEREYSTRDGSTATDTAKTIRRIVQYMNKAENVAGMFSYGTLFIVLVMVFVTILMSINERKKEMALMRTLGIGRSSISFMVMIETMITTFLGVILGVVIGHSVLWYFKPLIDMTLGINLEPFIFTSVEVQGIFLTLVAGQILALLGMLRIYRMNLIEEVARD